MPKAADVEQIIRRVREARGLSDLVIISIPAHEQGASKKEPAAFLPQFAHKLIEAGTDLVVGHVPHLFRGMELFNGKPIFYSLGNFIGQHELEPRFPAEGYERFRTDLTLAPGAVHQKRTMTTAVAFLPMPVLGNRRPGSHLQG